MNITELDEWQGLTAELVAKWLVVNGWQQTKPNWWDKGEDGVLFDSHVFDQQMFWLYALAAACGHNTPQALLREINPRMRKGVPSASAIVAHEASGGHWLAKSAQNGGVLRVLRWSVTDAAAKLDALNASQSLHRDYVPPSWHFWPCDANGNKVRWPEKDGVML